MNTRNIIRISFKKVSKIAALITIKKLNSFANKSYYFTFNVKLPDKNYSIKKPTSSWSLSPSLLSASR